MNIAPINKTNNTSSNQGFKKTSYNQNFGLFVLADAEAGEALVEKIIDHGNLKYVRKLVDFITLCKNKKEIVYINSKNPAKVYNEVGVQIHQTNDLNWLGTLYMALENVVGKDSAKMAESQSLKKETIGEIAKRLVDVLKDCPRIKDIQTFFNPTRASEAATKSAA